MAAPYRHIAVCLDDSPGSERALAEAVRLRELGPGRLSLVHAASWPISAAAAQGAIPNLERFFDAERGWLEHRAAAVPGAEAVFLIGYAPMVVRDWAAGHDCDLLVAGAHRGVFARLALGSFAGSLAYNAPCPLLIVRPTPVEDEPSEPERAAAEVG